MTDDKGERVGSVLAKIIMNLASFVIVHDMCLGRDLFVPESCTVAVSPLCPGFGKRRIAVCIGFWVWEVDNAVGSPVVDTRLRHALAFPSRSHKHRCHSRVPPPRPGPLPAGITYNRNRVVIVFNTT